MSDHTGMRLSPSTAAAAAVVLLGVGAASMYAWLNVGGGGPPASVPAPLGAAVEPDVAGTAAARGPVRITLSDEAVARAGIRIESVAAGRPARMVRVPGVVEPNGYRTVDVTALAGGQLTDVRAELGQRVSPGDVMAEVYSPELAQAEREYVAMRAELLAVRQRVARLERLTAIGAASVQELEREQAEAVRAAAQVEGVRARLQLLGLTPAETAALEGADQIRATMPVPATSSGVVTERMANRGQNVTMSSRLFTVVDLASVWVVGDVYERDLDLVRVGSEVTVTAAAVPGRTWRGRVSYIDPQIAMATRTARIRVEVDNPGERLKLGMFADLIVEEQAPGDAVLVAQSAVQAIGAADVVYVPDPAASGAFLERVVRLGRPAGDAVEVLEGLEPGDAVVTDGSFSLRAERERLGLAAPRPVPAPSTAGPEPAVITAPAPRRYDVAITDRGLEPATITIPAGTPVQIGFVRRTENTCGTDVVLPDLGVERDLPLNEVVVVAIPPQPAGELAFACSMGMLQGRIVVVAGGGD